MFCPDAGGSAILASHPTTRKPRVLGTPDLAAFRVLYISLLCVATPNSCAPIRQTFHGYQHRQECLCHILKRTMPRPKSGCATFLGCLGANPQLFHKQSVSGRKRPLAPISGAASTSSLTGFGNDDALGFVLTFSPESLSRCHFQLRYCRCFELFVPRPHQEWKT